MEVLSMAKVLLDPITRIEGHLSVEVDVQDGKVAEANCRGDMFRVYESILRGRNPVDANQITQRICGVCPVPHGLASSKCCDAAFGIKPNKNGRILRNLVLGANFLQSHIIHFYHLAALDFVDIIAILTYNGSDPQLLAVKAWVKDEIKTKKGRADAVTTAAPFLPRYEGDFYIKDTDLNVAATQHYLKALDIRLKAHKMVACFGGRVPHLIGLVPGGVTQRPTQPLIDEYKKNLKEVEAFVNEVYINDVIAVAKAYPDYFGLGGFANLLSYGVFEGDEDYKTFLLQRGVITGGKAEAFNPDHITEQVRYARYSSPSGLQPLQEETTPDFDKADAYTWLKAPRYNGLPMEVGPLPRVVVSYMSGNQAVKKEVDTLLALFNADVKALYSVLGRHAARAIESKLICQQLWNWLDELDVDGSPRTSYDIPDNGQGGGFVEAPRGALGHWIVVEGKKIANYQAVVPTTWFCGPRDDKGVPGPVEQALVGAPVSDSKNPIEVARIVRSFDPCIACAVHVVEGDREIGRFRIC